MEINASNEVVRAYVNGPGMDQPIERISFIKGTPRQRQVIHADGLGSIVALTDESGETVQTYSYAAFGGIRTQTGTDLNRITFTAREALGDSLGFNYYRYRVYDPSTGRFISEDPLGFTDSANRYVYCANNPIKYLDFFGLLSADVASIILQQYMEQNPEFAAKVRANWANKGNEVGWFCVDDSNNGYTIEPWPDHPDNTLDNVVGPGAAPPNAIGEGHTHPDPNGYGNAPSPGDYINGYGVDAFVFDPTWVYKYNPNEKPFFPKEQKRHGCK